MNESRFKSHVATLVISAVIFLLIGLETIPAQVKPSGGRKPAPTPALTWGIEVPIQATAVSEGLNFYGMEAGDVPGYHTYWNNDSNIRVIVQKLSPNYPYEFYFFIYNQKLNEGPVPNEDWVHFQNINLLSFEAPSDPDVNDFPVPYGGMPYPDRVMSFINEPQHPMPGYAHFMIHFQIFSDLYALPENTEVPLRNTDWGQFFLWNRNSCDGPDPNQHAYHTISGKFGTSDDEVGQGLFITRTGPAAWKLRVVNQTLEIQETYCVLEQVTAKNGKTTYYVDKGYSALVGCIGPVSFNLNVVSKAN